MKETLGNTQEWQAIEQTILSGVGEEQQSAAALPQALRAPKSARGRVINSARGFVAATGRYLSESGASLSKVPQYAVNGGIGASVAGRPGKYIVSLNDETDFMHPWHVTAWYDGEVKAGKGAWQVSIKPGFCNGMDPAIYAERANGYNPFSVYKTEASALGQVGGGEAVGIAGLFTNPLGASSAPDWIELSRGPVTSVQGYANRARLPEFFARQNGYNPNIDLASGAASTAQLLSSLGFQITNNGVTQDLTSGGSANARQVVGQDFWLEVPRAAYRTTVDIIANPLTGQLVDYNTVFDTSILDQREGQIRIYQGSIPQGREYEGLLADRLFSGDLDPNDPGVDVIPLFTFYLMQPPKDMRSSDDDGKPNGSWAPFVQYQTAWNLNHAVKNTPPININASAPIELTTAFFVGRFTLAAGALGAITAEFDRILNRAMNTVNGGKIWST